MRRLLLIGIGAGDPEQVTAQAIRALNAVDVFFVVDKGHEDLVGLRREICERYIERPGYRTVVMQDPARDRTAGVYADAVEAWRHARAELYAAAIGSELGAGECGDRADRAGQDQLVGPARARDHDGRAVSAVVRLERLHDLGQRLDREMQHERRPVRGERRQLFPGG